MASKLNRLLRAFAAIIIGYHFVCNFKRALPVDQQLENDSSLFDIQFLVQLAHDLLSLFVY